MRTTTPTYDVPPEYPEHRNCVRSLSPKMFEAGRCDTPSVDAPGLCISAHGLRPRHPPTTLRSSRKNPPHRTKGSGDCYSQCSRRIPLLQSDADSPMPVDRHDADSYQQEADADAHPIQRSETNRKIRSPRVSVSAPSAKVDCFPRPTTPVMQTVEAGSATCQDNKHHISGYRDISTCAPKQEVGLWVFEGIGVVF